MCTVHARAVVGRLETTPQPTASAQPQSQSRPGTPDLRCPPVNRRRAVTLVGMSAPNEYPRGLVSDSRGSLPEEPHAPDVLIIEYVPAQQGYALSPRSKFIGVRTATAVILPNPTDSAAAESNSSAGLLSTRRVHEPARPQPPEAVWCSRAGVPTQLTLGLPYEGHVTRGHLRLVRPTMVHNPRLVVCVPLPAIMLLWRKLLLIPRTCWRMSLFRWHKR